MTSDRIVHCAECGAQTTVNQVVTHEGRALCAGCLREAVTGPLEAASASAINLATCRDCGGTVSRSAKACPHCGRPEPNVGPVLHGVTTFATSMLNIGLIVLAICILIGGCSVVAAIVGAAEAPPRAAHKVGRIVDGDTIHVAGHFGNAETTEIIRLMGINSPERGAHYAKESTTWLTNLLKGEDVTLVYESETPTRDRYGRIIAYVYRAPDGLDVCGESLRQGYAKAYTGKHPRRDEFAKTEATAHSAERGLWGAPD